MRFKQVVHELIASQQLDSDPQQTSLIDSLDHLAAALESERRGSGQEVWLTRFKKAVFGHGAKPPKDQIKGLYIWGGVGRGKTHLMNLFFEQVAIKQKWRVHFHRFMLWVHEQNGKLANQTDPLKLIAKQVSDKNKLLCLDEFMVTDIADAMILHGLLKHLYAQGVVLVTTSNIPPDALYADGIQRDSFLGAIKLIHQHSHVLEVSGDKDFRAREWVFEEIYFSPLGEQAHAGLLRCYHQLTGATQLNPEQLMIAGRPIPAVSVAEGLAWFEFDQLCRSYRSPMDYIELVNRFDTLIIANIPALDEEDDAEARRFINLIDTAYDYQAKLLLSAAVSPDKLYQGSKLAQPFKRTASRLWEMSSQDYLSAHREVI